MADHTGQHVHLFYHHISKDVGISEPHTTVTIEARFYDDECAKAFQHNAIQLIVRGFICDSSALTLEGQQAT